MDLHSSGFSRSKIAPGTSSLSFRISCCRGGSKGEGAGGAHPSPPHEMTCGFLIQLVSCKKKTMWFVGVEVEQETSAPPPKTNPGSALVLFLLMPFCYFELF